MVRCPFKGAGEIRAPLESIGRVLCERGPEYWVEDGELWSGVCQGGWWGVEVVN